MFDKKSIPSPVMKLMIILSCYACFVRPSPPSFLDSTLTPEVWHELFNLLEKVVPHTQFSQGDSESNCSLTVYQNAAPSQELATPLESIPDLGGQISQHLDDRPVISGGATPSPEALRDLFDQLEELGPDSQLFQDDTESDRSLTNQNAAKSREVGMSLEDIPGPSHGVPENLDNDYHRLRCRFIELKNLMQIYDHQTSYFANILDQLGLTDVTLRLEIEQFFQTDQCYSPVRSIPQRDLEESLLQILAIYSDKMELAKKFEEFDKVLDKMGCKMNLRARKIAQSYVKSSRLGRCLSRQHLNIIEAYIVELSNMVRELNQSIQYMITEAMNAHYAQQNVSSNIKN
ncbi:hypothetical protein QAD02_016330 [Eretmocerus hayati]|uniref:Uncharacterized protein n=1 Tax=Eretmocerus hayati TaxID=131215 RepID=A0ACC2PAS4_9HYME|nr:hypothetical protein QAD02_016330 [Eretmocerus hayati]